MFFKILKFTSSKIEPYTIIKPNSHKNIKRTIYKIYLFFCFHYRVRMKTRNQIKNNKREYKHYKNFYYEESNKDTNPKPDYKFWEKFTVTD